MTKTTARAIIAHALQSGQITWREACRRQRAISRVNRPRLVAIWVSDLRKETA